MWIQNFISLILLSRDTTNFQGISWPCFPSSQSVLSNWSNAFSQFSLFLLTCCFLHTKLFFILHHFSKSTHFTKGQLISKAIFLVLTWTKVQWNHFLISALGSKKRSNQKNKGTLYHYLAPISDIECLYFLIRPLFRG